MVLLDDLNAHQTDNSQPHELSVGFLNGPSLSQRTATFVSMIH